MPSKPTVLITGCTDGSIGSSLALTFTTHNYHVYATSRTLSSMSALQSHPSITLLPLDILNPTHVQNAVDAIAKDTNGTLDILVNNAGRARFMPLLDEDLDAARELYETNVWAPLGLVQAFGEMLIKAKGMVVFNTSVSGYLNVPWQGTYAASKRSLEILADNLRVELAPFDVSVISIVTGAVASNVHSPHESWKMPSSSRYYSVQESFAKRAKGDDGSARMDSRVYAEGVVGKLVVLAGKKVGSGETKIWYGNAAGFVRFAVGWFPTRLLDWALAKGTGIDIMMKAK